MGQPRVDKNFDELLFFLIFELKEKSIDESMSSLSPSLLSSSLLPLFSCHSAAVVLSLLSLLSSKLSSLLLLSLSSLSSGSF